MKTPAQLVNSGFNGPQTTGLMRAFPVKPEGVAKIGLPDAEDEESAIKLANACKARLNDLIEALKA